MPHELDELSLTIGEIKAAITQLSKRAEEDRTQIKDAIRDLADKLDQQRQSTAQTVRNRDAEALARHVENQAQIGKLTVMIGDNASAMDEFKYALQRHEANVLSLQPQITSLQGTRKKLMGYAAVGLATVASIVFVAEALMKAGFNWLFSKFSG